MNLLQALESAGQLVPTEKIETVLHHGEPNLFVYYELTSSWNDFQELAGIEGIPTGPILEPLTEPTLVMLARMQAHHLIAGFAVFQVDLYQLDVTLSNAQKDTGNALLAVERARARTIRIPRL